MSTLKLSLLGSPRIEQDGRAVEIPRHKALALLAFLAITQESHTRDALATMLWPEADASHARGALRRALSDIGKAIGSVFDTTGESIACKSGEQVPDPAGLWVDAHSFHALVATSIAHPHPLETPCPECLARLTEAAALYRDDFMQGFTLPDCPQFDEWQFFQTESYRQELAAVLERLVREHRMLGNVDDALLFARRWSALDPLQESPQRAAMELYASSGQRSAALRQYREYVRILDEEMNAAPAQELVLLAERIRRGELAPQDEQASISSVGAAAHANRQDEIRFVTVLFAGLDHDDSLNPDTLAASVELLRQIVAESASRYGGYVSPLIAQGIQVLFGFPQMHEDDPERTLRAALAIRDAAQERRLRLSIGISTGRVYLGPTLADSSQVTTIGPVVGLATRLQARASINKILVAESTFKSTRRAFDFGPTLVEIASSGGPTKAFELKGTLPHPDKVRGIEGMRAELVGRDPDLQSCRAALDAVVTGQGGILSIVGEAGIGKSRLVEELARIAQAERERGNLMWLSSRCSEFSNSVAYSPFVDLIGSWLDSLTRKGQTRAYSLWDSLSDLVRFGALDKDQRDEIAAYLGHLLSLRLSEGDTRVQDARPELIRHRTFRAVYDFLVALAQVQPLVLVFEDLHWADAISLDLLAYLVEAIPTAPILLVCVHRPEPPPKLKRIDAVAAAKCPARYTQVLLRDLTPDQGQHMVRSMLRTSRLPPAIGELLTRVWGNPFFIEETVRGLVDAGLLFRSHNEWNARDVGSLPVPDSIQSVILSRVDRLAPELKRVLCAAAVIGRLFEPELLEIMLHGTDVAHALDRLEEATLVYQDRVLPQVEYSFKHVLTQETVYQNLSRQQREELHRQVAAAIERLYLSGLEEHYEELAHHYAESRDVDKAVEYLVQAGDKSRRAALNQAAVGYFDRALQLAETRQTVGPSILSRVTALTGLGRIYHLIGKAHESEQYLRQAIELGQRAGVDTRTLARINYWLGQVLHWQGRYGEQMWLGESGLALLSRNNGESVEAAMMNEMIASGSIQRGDRDRFYALAEQNAQLLPRLPYAEELPSLYQHVLLSLSDQRKDSHFQPWLEMLDRLAKVENDRFARAIAHEIAARRTFAQGRLTHAEEQLSQALAVHSSTGDSINTWRCLDGSAWLNMLQGNLKGAQEKAWQAIAIAEPWGFNRIISESHLCLAAVSFAQRDWDSAAARFRKAIEFSQGSDPFWTEWAGLYGLARVAVAEGDKAQAQHLFEQALVLFSPQLVPLGWEQHRWWSLSACILAGLESVCADEESFRALCNNLEEFKLQHAMPPIPMQWYAEPASPDLHFSNDLFRSANQDSSSIENRRWYDPLGDCSYRVEDGIEIRAANGRDLWYLNTSSPRFTHSVSGNCAIDATCSKAESDRPTMGGLLIWKDESNMLRLVWGTRGERDVSFEGCIDDTDLIVGRGLLPKGDSSKVWLRLERLRDQTRALASSDGVEWYSFGQIAFPVDDPVEIGIHAVGWIDRTIYPGDYGDGTAIRFESFHVKRD